MKRQLQVLICLASLLMGGVSSVWGDNVATLYNSDDSKVNDYESLDAAVKAASSDGQYIVITATEVYWGDSDGTSGRLKAGYSITIKPAENTNVTIKTTKTNTSAQFQVANGKTLSFDGDVSGASLTIDGNGNTRSLFESGNSNMTFSLKKVTLTNKGASTLTESGSNNIYEGCINMKNGNLILEDVTFSYTNNSYNVRIAAGSLTMKGSMNFSSGSHANICIGGTATINASEITFPGSPITVTVESYLSSDYTITDGTDRNYFSIQDNDNYQIVNSGDNVIVQYKPTCVYNATNGLWYSSFESAYADATADDELQLNENITLSSLIKFTKNVTIKQFPDKDITVTRDIISAWIIMSKDGDVNPNVTIDGSGTGSLTFSGGEVTNNTGVAFESANTTGEPGTNNILTLKSIKIINMTNTSGNTVVSRNRGSVILEDVTFENCSNSNGLLYARNGSLTMKSSVTFTNCTGPNIYIEKATNGRVVENSLSKPATPYTVKFDAYPSTTGQNVSNFGTASYYRLTSDFPGWYLKKDGDMLKAYQTTTSYALTIGAAGMSTLVLPFNVTTLPTGSLGGTLTAYKLTTTGSVVKAKEITDDPIIEKHKPVLIVSNSTTSQTYTFNADTGTFTTSTVDNRVEGIGTVETTTRYGVLTDTYTLKNAVPTLTSQAFTPNATSSQNGALIGTYYAIDAEDGNYVLQNQAGNGVGFYKLVESSNHVVNPFRAYLSGDANNPASSARLAIVFEDNEPTGIKNITTTNGDAIYNLCGQRTNKPLKGIYVKDGKKYYAK